MSRGVRAVRRPFNEGVIVPPPPPPTIHPVIRHPLPTGRRYVAPPRSLSVVFDYEVELHCSEAGSRDSIADHGVTLVAHLQVMASDGYGATVGKGPAHAAAGCRGGRDRLRGVAASPFLDRLRFEVTVTAGLGDSCFSSAAASWRGDTRLTLPTDWGAWRLHDAAGGRPTPPRDLSTVARPQPAPVSAPSASALEGSDALPVHCLE